MRKMKKVLCLLLSLMIILLVMPISVFAEDDILDYLEYEIRNGEATIIGCDTSISGDVIIPDTIEGYSVTSIGIGAFYSCHSLTNISIGNNVESIGESAFPPFSLTKIIVDKNNNFYSSDEFGVLFNKDKTSLLEYPAGNTRTSYLIPESVKSIGDWAFSFCKLTSITIPNSVTNIGECAFYWCNCLTNITINNPYCEIYDSNSTISHGLAPKATIYGYKNSTAQVYAEKYNRTFVSLDTECIHGYTSEITTPATHLTEGLMTYTCHCGDSYTESIAKIEKHEHTAVVTAPTCTEDGFTTYTCECGDTYVADYADATGHKDANGDNKCDSCEFVFETDEDDKTDTDNNTDTDNGTDNDENNKRKCYCACHSENSFVSFFQKIVRFLRSLFGLNFCRQCKCDYV